MFAHPALIKKENDGFVVSFPGLSAFSEGDTIEEAFREASDALETALSVYVQKRLDLPKPTKVRLRTQPPSGKSFQDGHYLIFPSALGAMKLALYVSMQDQGIRKSDLARMLGRTKTEMDRLLDLTHLSRVDQIETALRALGKRVEIAIRPAA